MQQANGLNLVANVAGICNSEHTLHYGEGVGEGGGHRGWRVQEGGCTVQILTFIQHSVLHLWACGGVVAALPDV